MKTSEMIAMLEKNPKLRFKGDKWIDGSVLQLDKEGIFYLQGSNNWGFSGKLLTDGKWFIEDSPNES